MSSKEDLTGTKVTVTATIIEHLVLGKKEWITILLPNNEKVTLNLALCQLTDTNKE